MSASKEIIDEKEHGHGRTVEYWNSRKAEEAVEKVENILENSEPITEEFYEIESSKPSSAGPVYKDVTSAVNRNDYILDENEVHISGEAAYKLFTSLTKANTEDFLEGDVNL